MNEKEKELKAFNQCADALGSLENKSIFKVFQLLSVHFEFIPKNIQPERNFEDKGTTAFLQPVETEKANEYKHKEADKNENKIEVKKTTATKAKPVKASSSKSPTYLIDFDLMPNDKESLKAFSEKYNINTNFERNLVCLYYLQEILKTENITVNHVYTCYRNLNAKIPLFPQTLFDTKHRKGWIDTANISDLKVTRTGSNHIEHDKAFQKED
ncbi:hypothetical protein GJU39_21985 [Pedobacter petrophilus]|uniref:Uncharacterized protein n=1 Tax=Pedobacter petrophilus TaxID=1908241 RepID=A0A7K0G535_9SPHI|nr:hypothetical protein [Pedobacter petrophilus]MRX78751.1 hypothetical protein [Pedobacter petrophilus]